MGDKWNFFLSLFLSLSLFFVLKVCFFGPEVWRSVIRKTAIFVFMTSEEQQRGEQLRVGTRCPGEEEEEEEDSHLSDLVHWGDS